MKRYLIVANQTATERRLVRRIRQVRDDEPDARFVLLVPATRVEHLATWQSGESEDVARSRGEQARSAFAEMGVLLDEILVGDEAPIWAIEDELRGRDDGYYDVVVLSTLPPGVSRWLARDVHSLAEARLHLPVLHVFEGGEALWQSRHAQRRARGVDAVLFGSLIPAPPSSGAGAPVSGPQRVAGIDADGSIPLHHGRTGGYGRPPVPAERRDRAGRVLRAARRAATDRAPLGGAADRANLTGGAKLDGAVRENRDGRVLRACGGRGVRASRRP